MTGLCAVSHMSSASRRRSSWYVRDASSPRNAATRLRIADVGLMQLRSFAWRMLRNTPVYDDAGTGTSCESGAMPCPRLLRRLRRTGCDADPHRNARRMRIVCSACSCTAMKPGHSSEVRVSSWSAALCSSSAPSFWSKPSPASPSLPVPSSPAPPSPFAAASALSLPPSPLESSVVLPAAPTECLFSWLRTFVSRSAPPSSSVLLELNSPDAVAFASAAAPAAPRRAAGFMATRITVFGTACHGALKRQMPVLIACAFFRHVDVCLSSCDWLSKMTAAANMASTSSQSGERGSCRMSLWNTIAASTAWSVKRYGTPSLDSALPPPTPLPPPPPLPYSAASALRCTTTASMNRRCARCSRSAAGPDSPVPSCASLHIAAHVVFSASRTRFDATALRLQWRH